ncbi:MAG: CopG family ribbon-helix-helix protein [Xenococcaceae cyanobacterium]
MANSPLVSIRIPPETLERIDKLAQKFYPSRRAGRSPNRSQVILDAIDQFLKQQESSDANIPNIEEQITKVLQEYHQQIEKQIKQYIDDKFLAYTYNLEKRLHSARKGLK